LSPYGLALTAIINAADDAGIDVKEIDGLVSHSGEPFTTSAIVDGLGLSRFSYGSQPLDLTAGGAPFAVQLAADAVEQGRADVVVVYKALRMGAADRFGRPGGHVVDNRDERIGSGKTVRHEHVYVRSLAGAFSAPYGASVAAQHWALHAQRHMYQYGTTSRQFGMVAKTFRDHAARNPRALYRTTFTIDEHQSSRMISTPLRLLDCCMESDSAIAFLVTTADRARSCKTRPVRILSSAYGTDVGMTQIHGWSEYPTSNLRSIRERLWGQAGVGPKDVDTAQIYDHFSSGVIMALEDLGFCPIGEGGPFVATGAIAWPDGELPTNTSGGMLSEVYCVDMNLLAEGIRQIRGESTSQVPGAEVALVTGGGAACPNGAILLAPD